MSDQQKKVKPAKRESITPKPEVPQRTTKAPLPPAPGRGVAPGITG